MPRPPIARARPYGAAFARPGRGGTPLSPYNDRPFGELAELFRLDATPPTRPRTAPAGRPARSRPYRRGINWLVPAAAAGSLTVGIALAHGLLIAGGLVLAGLSWQLSGGRDQRR